MSYIRTLAAELGVDTKGAATDLDVAHRLLNAIPGPKNVDPRHTNNTVMRMSWRRPKQFGGADYEVSASNFVSCAIQLGHQYRKQLRDNELRRVELRSQQTED